MSMQEQREAHEAILDRLNRRLRTLSQCTNTLLQAESEQELLQTVWPVAQAGSGLDYLERVQTSWGEMEPGQGPPGVAARTGKACWVDDIRTDPRFSRWRVAALARGYASCIA